MRLVEAERGGNFATTICLYQEQKRGVFGQRIEKRKEVKAFRDRGKRFSGTEVPHLERRTRVKEKKFENCNKSVSDRRVGGGGGGGGGVGRQGGDGVSNIHRVQPKAFPSD